MSVEQATAFLAHVQENEELQRILAALRGADSLEQLAAIGRERGFHFNEEEYREAVVAAAEGELSDEAIAEAAKEAGLSLPAHNEAEDDA